MSYHLNRDSIDYHVPARFAVTWQVPRVIDRIIIAPPPKRITIDSIKQLVAEHFGIPLIEMTSSRRARDVARPRQVAMYLARHHTPRTLPDIGRRFGNRDHTTVLHALRTIERLRAEDADLDADVKALEAKL